MDLLLSFIFKKREKHDVWERNVIDWKQLSSHVMDVGPCYFLMMQKQRTGPAHTVRSQKQVGTKWNEEGFKDF